MSEEEAAHQEVEEEEDNDDLPVLEKRTDILYCGVCSIPPEYCEFNPPELYSDCLKWQSENYPELLPTGVSLEDLLAELKIGGSKKGATSTSTADENASAGEDEGDEADDKKKSKKGGGPKGLKKKKDSGASGKVIITRMSRNKRKSVTVVNGLDTYPELKIKDIAKALGKAFACGASVSDTASGGKEIIIQGDVLEALAGMLVDNYQVPEENIVLKA